MANGSKAPPKEQHTEIEGSKRKQCAKCLENGIEGL